MADGNAISNALPVAELGAAVQWSGGALTAAALVCDATVRLDEPFTVTLSWALPREQGERALVLEVAQVRAGERSRVRLRTAASAMPAFARVSLIPGASAGADPLDGATMRTVLGGLRGAMRIHGEERWQPRGELVTVRSAALASVDEAALAAHGISVRRTDAGAVELYTSTRATLRAWRHEKPWIAVLAALAGSGFIVHWAFGLVLVTLLAALAGFGLRQPRAQIDADRIVVGGSAFFRDQIRDVVPGRIKPGFMVVALDGEVTWCAQGPANIAEAVRELWQLEPIPAVVELDPGARDALPSWAQLDAETGRALDARWHEGTLVCGEVALTEGAGRAAERTFARVDVRLFAPSRIDLDEEAMGDQANQPTLKDLISGKTLLYGKRTELEPLVDVVNAAAGPFEPDTFPALESWTETGGRGRRTLAAKAGKLAFTVTTARITTPSGTLARKKIKRIALSRSRITFERIFSTFDESYVCVSPKAAKELYRYLEAWHAYDPSGAEKRRVLAAILRKPAAPPARPTRAPFRFGPDHLVGEWPHWSEVARSSDAIEFEHTGRSAANTLRLRFGTRALEAVGQTIEWNRLGQMVVAGDCLTLTRGPGHRDDITFVFESMAVAFQTKKLIGRWRELVAAHH